MQTPLQLEHTFWFGETMLPNTITVKKSVFSFQEPFTAAALYALGDANAALVYLVLEQSSGVTHYVAVRTKLL